MLDEALDVIARLWTAEPIIHRGAHYRFAGPDGWGAVHHPPPVQAPRVPVWVAGTWLGDGSTGGRPLRRAARWDGVMPMRLDGAWEPADTAGVVAAVSRQRDSMSGYDVAIPGESDPTTSGAVVEAQAAAGATWWVESWWDVPQGPEGLAEVRRRVEAGPPPLS